MMNQSQKPKSSYAPSGNLRDIVIPVMGRTGVGKSTFINTVLKQNIMKVGHDQESCTSSIALAEVDTSLFLDNFPFLENRRLFLVDTRGFDDTYVDDSVILKETTRWLETVSRTKLVGGLIYIQDTSNLGFTKPERKNLNDFYKLCGDVGALDKVVLLGTTIGKVSLARENNPLGRLKEIDGGAQTFQFNGSHDSALKPVNAVLERFKETVLDAQFEVTDHNRFTPPVRGRGSQPDLSRSPPDIVIPVMGPTGVGKSTFINAVLEQNRMKVGYEIESCTVEIATAAVDTSTLLRDFPWLKNRRLLLVDTPGFDDTYVDDSVILERIAKWLGNSYREQQVLGGVIYLHDISKNRFTGSVQKNLAVFNRLCGQGALDKVVLGTTMASRIPPTEAARRLCGLKERHWNDIIKSGAQVFQLNGDHSSASGLLNIILKRYEEKEKTVLEIQRELVDKKKKIPETEAGKELRSTLLHALDQHKRRAESSGRAAQGDPDADAQVLEKEQIDQIYKQLHKLEIPLLRRLLAILGF